MKLKTSCFSSLNQRCMATKIQHEVENELIFIVDSTLLATKIQHEVENELLFIVDSTDKNQQLLKMS